MKICFLDNTRFQYSYKDIYSPKLRGAETILINLSNELKAKGHDVIVYNNCLNNDVTDNWKNLNNIEVDNIEFDIAISNADANLFNNIKAKKKFVLSYSLQTIEKFIRKNQMISYIKHKPHYILIGEYHKKNRPKLTTLFGASILNLAVDDIFLKSKLSDSVDCNQAIFTSRPDRNSDLLIEIWKKKIFPSHNKAKLLITPNNNEDTKFNIIERQMKSQNDLINDLLKSRIFLVPGHKAELFCLAAEEARELCIPIVTMGIGSLYERVNHGNTGFVAQNMDEFAHFTIELFKNNKLWSDIRLNLIKLRGSYTWSNCSDNFLKIIS